ncbi:MAG: DUF547 domain-containing protein [Planctomycetes bacterium]|nr:DUF547 domain-containing protein [Planctomycetota bacterium]MCB9916988.1 DUF547 domain-containing protein [Planctomycetota bacterium]
MPIARAIVLVVCLASCAESDTHGPSQDPHGSKSALSMHGNAGAAAALEARKKLPSLTAYDALLREASQADGVNYEVVRKHRKVVDDLLAAIAVFDVESVDAVARLTLVINAYNAAVLRIALDGVVDGDKASIDAGLFEEPALKFAGREMSLDQLAAFGRALKDPRIHFALHRAMRSSPPLRNRAYEPETLESDLDAVTQSFLASQYGAQIRERQVFVNELFESSLSDWGGEEGVKNFLRLHAPALVKEYLDAPLGYLVADSRLAALQR